MENNVGSNQGEIDLIELVKLVWVRKGYVASITGIFVVLGILIAFTSPKEYVTSTTLIPESIGAEGILSGSLGSLASLAGVNLGDVQGAQSINPALYKSIAESTPFLLGLMRQPFYFEKLQKEVTLYTFIKEHKESSLLITILTSPFRLLGFIKSYAENTKISKEDKLLSLTKEELNVLKELKGRVSVNMDWDLNVVTIEAEMQDPLVAAEIAQYTQNYITEYVKSYMVAKGMEQLSFIEDQLATSKDDFENIQMKFAMFRDANKYVNTARAKSEEERLQSEYNIAYNVYNQLAQQRETVKFQINVNTPVFTVLEPVSIPVEKSSPKRGLILVGFMFIGVLVGVTIILFKSTL